MGIFSVPQDASFRLGIPDPKNGRISWWVVPKNPPPKHVAGEEITMVVKKSPPVKIFHWNLGITNPSIGLMTTPHSMGTTVV